MTKPIELAVHLCQCTIWQTGADPGIREQQQRMNLFLSRLTEPQRRWYVGMLSQEPDRPSDVVLARITGLDRDTIARGRRELHGADPLPPGRIRRPGGGRKPVEITVPGP